MIYCFVFKITMMIYRELISHAVETFSEMMSLIFLGVNF